MKNTLTTLLLILILSSCSSDDKTKAISEIDKLPPATQNGKNTFGCLLDGKAFTPGNRPNPLDCVYQDLNGTFYLSLQANRDIDNLLVLVGLSTNSLMIEENKKYTLSSNVPATAYGTYAVAGTFSTTDIFNIGELFITKLDAQVVSGTFWFDVVDNNGVLHEIREGRFDMEYSN